jgi:hypothetical protein
MTKRCKTRRFRRSFEPESSTWSRVSGPRWSIWRIRFTRGHGDGEGGNSYFPVATQASHFKGRFERCLPGVAEKCPDVRDAIEDRQPYREGYEWLQHLVLLTNENKHRRLSPQTRQEQRETHFDFPGGASIIMGEGASISMGPGADITSGGRSIREIQPTVRVYVDWLFAEPPISALRTLETIQVELPRLVEDVLGALP